MQLVFCDVCGKSGAVCSNCGSAKSDTHIDTFLNEGPDVGGFEICVCAGCQLRLRRKYVRWNKEG